MAEYAASELLVELRDYLREHPAESRRMLTALLEQGQPFPAPGALRAVLQRMAAGADEVEPIRSAIGRALAVSCDAVVAPPTLCLTLRPMVGCWQHIRVDVDTLEASAVPAGDFLALKERLVDDDGTAYPGILEVDFTPFCAERPRLKEPTSIGRGLRLVCRSLCSDLFPSLQREESALVSFLTQISHRGSRLLLGEQLADTVRVRRALRQADDVLSRHAATAPARVVLKSLSGLGFEPGWGNTVARIRETMGMLRDLLEAPDSATLEQLLARLPLVFSAAIISPHGFFAQSNVLGRPDTGGQVVYILDQVAALETEMRARLLEQGLETEPQIVIVTRQIPESPETTCSERIEAIVGTHNAHILRVAFRDPDGETVPQWISRFEVWPYLERFAREVEEELLRDLGEPPGLIMGNYSDGNLVAWMLASRLGSTFGTIAHALEKTKYVGADLHWKRHESRHHLSCQLTADLIAMNGSDFIVTSTYQEIAGTPDSLGQYESHMAFTMPQLYRVRCGIDPYDLRFNIIPPGADPSVYFPYNKTGRRFADLHGELEELLYGDDARPDARGVLEDRDKPVLFTITRLDAVKNIDSLMQWFGRDHRLREHVNLLVVAGHVDPGRSEEEDERAQIDRLHDLMDQYKLDGHVRWLGMLLDKSLAGELYRYVADTQGAFVQPAIHEGFGLTVVEAMSCGLPTFATRHGGPLEIIEDGLSGFHIDPHDAEATTQRIVDFFERCRDDPDHWEEVSRAALSRVEQHFNWAKYADRLLTTASVYRFWGMQTAESRQAGRRYLEMFYNLQYRLLAAQVPRA